MAGHRNGEEIEANRVRVPVREEVGRERRRVAVVLVDPDPCGKLVLIAIGVSDVVAVREQNVSDAARPPPAPRNRLTSFWIKRGESTRKFPSFRSTKYECAPYDERAL